MGIIGLVVPSYQHGSWCVLTRVKLYYKRIQTLSYEYATLSLLSLKKQSQEFSLLFLLSFSLVTNLTVGEPSTE